MKSQTAQLVKVLKTAIGALGFTLKEVESRLGRSRGHLTRLFGGEYDLKVDHVVEIAEVLGLEPEEIFRLAFPMPQREPTEIALTVREACGITAAPPAQPQMPSVLEMEIERLVNRAMGKAFAKLQSS